MKNEKNSQIYYIPPDFWNDMYNDPYNYHYNDPWNKNLQLHVHVTNLLRHIVECAFPLKYDNNILLPVITLASKDDTLLELFCEKDGNIDQSIRGYFDHLIYYKKMAFQIFLGSTKKCKLIYFPAKSLTYSFFKGKYYHKSLKSMERYCRIDEICKNKYFNKDKFFIIKMPKVFLRIFPAVKVFWDIKPINENLVYEEKLFRRRIFSNISGGHIDNYYLTEYYTYWSYLRFAETVAAAREDFMRQMNLFLKTLCNKLRLPDNEFIISNVLSSEDCCNMRMKLKHNKVSFREILDKFL
jgi:hypothetical protein